MSEYILGVTRPREKMCRRLCECVTPVVKKHLHILSSLAATITKQLLILVAACKLVDRKKLFLLHQ